MHILIPFKVHKFCFVFIISSSLDIQTNTHTHSLSIYLSRRSQFHCKLSVALSFTDCIVVRFIYNVCASLNHCLIYVFFSLFFFYHQWQQQQRWQRSLMYTWLATILFKMHSMYIEHIFFFELLLLWCFGVFLFRSMFPRNTIHSFMFWYENKCGAKPKFLLLLLFPIWVWTRLLPRTINLNFLMWREITMIIEMSKFYFRVFFKKHQFSAVCANAFVYCICLTVCVCVCLYHLANVNDTNWFFSRDRSLMLCVRRLCVGINRTSTCDHTTSSRQRTRCIDLLIQFQLWRFYGNFLRILFRLNFLIGMGFFFFFL